MVGLLRGNVDPATLGATIVAAVAGHSLICARRGALDQLPARVESMSHDMLPRIATDAWLTHRLR
jgi:hypothetical protein